MARKSAKRVRAGRKAWRTRLAKLRARRSNPKKKKSRKSYSKPSVTPTRRKRRKSRKAGRNVKGQFVKKGGRRRKGRKASKKRTYSRRRKPVGWRGNTGGHRKASKKGWYGRYHDKKLRTYRGEKYRKPMGKSRGKFPRWKNPKHFIRVKNPDGIKDVALPIALAIGGIIGATLLMKKLFIDKDTDGKSILDATKMPKVADINLGLLIPAAIGIASMVFLTKKAPKYAKMIYGVGFGLTVASGIAVYNQVVANVKIKNKDSQLPTIGGSLMGYTTYPFSGYVRSMRGYVRSPLAGYVPANLGQLEQRIPRTLGEPVTYRGAIAPAGVKSQRALAYQPLSVKPYGMGMPKESRRYNEFDFSGVYGDSVYE